MRKICLLILSLFLSFNSEAVEPWSGIGVVYFRCHYPEMTGKSTDLDIFDSTLTRKIMSINSTNYYLSEKVDFIEFADDVKGLCIVSIQEKTIKVILNGGVSPIQYGWLKKDEKDIGYILWSDLIPNQKNVFPINNKEGIAEITFYKAPNGEVLNIQIPKMKELWYDYRNDIIKIYDCDLIPTGLVYKESWMQVDISYPHDEGEDIFECHRVRCWIRYLDDFGHPLVWFHTRD